MSIYYFNEDCPFILPDEAGTTNWITTVLHKEGFSVKNINYIFCSDEHLLKINQEYLHHDTLTDIITFDHSDSNTEIESDIFISIDRVKENADQLGKPFIDELHRVMIHGLLHIMGFADKSDEEKRVMREKEDACLSLR